MSRNKSVSTEKKDFVRPKSYNNKKPLLQIKLSLLCNLVQARETKILMLFLSSINNLNILFRIISNWSAYHVTKKNMDIVLFVFFLFS